jgi:molybdopterin molybdotransferase
MIPISEALKIINRETGTLGVERIDLADAIGRVLAEDVIADTDMPPFDRSQMDGYAVIASDTENAPAELKIVGESAAGLGWKGKLKSGESVRIMTGAPVPAGADAIQKLELATESERVVKISEATSAGRYIVHRGTEIKKGKVVMRSGETITPNSISIPAAFGYAKIKVAKRPRVAILSTGSEIVEINKTPKTDQIRNSNSLMLAALCRRAGAEPTLFPITGDNISDLKSQISNVVKSSDILITTGGVSVGKYDLTKAALTELGAEIFFERVRLKPGKPTVFTRLKKTLVFGLPGNPVSAAVTYYLFVRKAILQMQNAAKTELEHGTAIAAKPVKAPQERDAYIPATISADAAGRVLAEPLHWHGSSDFIGFAESDALIGVPRGKSFESGECVKILYLR